MKPVLGYWKTRALCQTIRLMLKYLGIEFEDKYYPVGEGPKYDKSEWLAAKNNLGLDFPNLPYYIDGDVKLTQSKAIMRYLARENDLLGTTSQEQARTDMVEYQLTDQQNEFFDVTYWHYLTYVDFLAYEVFDQHLYLDGTCLDGFENLRKFQKRFEDLEPIKKYLASPEFLKSPICNKYAQFANK